MQKIYISGPMTGYPEANYPAFMAKEEELKADKWAVYNPARFPFDGPIDDFPIREAFAEYCQYICTEADAIYMLPGWEKSSGARVEHDLAKRIGLKITYALDPHTGTS